MGEFFDTETGLPLQEEENLEQGFLSGDISLNRDSVPNLYDPITGKTIKVDANKIMEGLELGLKFETEEQRVLREFKNDPANQGLIPAVKTFGAQLADEFALGIPETVIDVAQGQDSLEYKKRQIIKEQNPIANFLGGTTGFGLSLLYGGPVWKGIAKTGEVVASPLTKLAAAGVGEAGLKKFALQTAEQAVKYGTEGAVLAAPEAISEIVLGDHDSVAEALLAAGEDLGEGALLGGLIGGGASVIGKTLKAGSQIFGDIPLSEALQKRADIKKLKAVGLKQAEIEKIISGQTPNTIEETANFLAEKDLVGFKAMREGSEARLEKLQTIISDTGKDLGKVYSQIDDAGIKVFDPSLVLQKGDELAANFQDAIDKSSLKQIKKLQETVLSRGEKPITFKEAQKLVSKIGNFAFPKGLITQDMAAAQRYYGIVKKELEDSVQLAASAMKNPEFSQLYSQTKKNISIAKQLEAPFEKAFARQTGNNSISLTDYISAVGFGSATGSVPAALSGLVMNNLKRHYGDYVTYKLLEAAAKGVDRFESRMNGALNNALGLSDKIENIKPASINLLRSFLGDKYNEEDRLENLKSFQGSISAFMNDSNASLGSLSLLTKQYDEAAPNVSQAMKAKATAAISYLAEQMPKPKTVYSGVDTRTYKPSDMEIASFERKAQAVMDPLSVIEELQSGAVMSDQVEAIKTVYPSLFKAIQQKVLEKVNKNPSAIPYATKQKVFKLLELPGEGMEARRNITQLQRNFRTNFKPKPQANSKINYGNRIGTDIDRIAYE